MQIDLYNNSGEKKGKLTLCKEIFEAEVNVGLIHRAVVMQRANIRQVSAKTKTRGEVRGGGKKPWKQKGTGRARSGSIRNPIWRGGGITFGPTGEQNYTVDMPKKQRRKALFGALSQKATEKNIIGLEDIKTKEGLKTKNMAELIDKLPVQKGALIVLPKGEQVLKKALKNIPYIGFVESGYLNVYDLLKYETLIFMESSVAEVNQTWEEAAKELYKNNVKSPAKETPVKKVEEKKEEKKPAVKKAVAKKPVAKKPAAKKATTKKDNK